jgi:hypothetical protein
VKFPTGGKAREPRGRFGVTPKPTVKSGWKKVCSVIEFFALTFLCQGFLFTINVQIKFAG